MNKSYYFLEGENSQYKVVSAQRFAEQNNSKILKIHQEISQDSDITSTKSVEWAYWGSQNDLPNKIVEAVADNSVAMGLLELRADLDYGKGWWLYKIVGFDAEGEEIKERVSNPEIEDFFEANNIENYFQQSFDDYEYFGNVFTEFRKNREGKIGFIKHLDASMMRTSNRLNLLGNVDLFFHHHDWKNYKKSEIKRIAAYQQQSEFQPSKFIYHAKNYFSTSIFYGVAAYLGSMKWMSVSSKVPTWHEVNMDNAWNVKYHVELDSEYFTRNFPDLDEEARNLEEEKFKTALSKYLSGVENVGKTLVSKFIWDSIQGKAISTLTINPITNETNHEAYLPLFTQSNSAICSGLRVSPAIAPIDTGNSLSNADKYVEFEVHSEINTMRPRMNILEPFKVLWKHNNWDRNIKLGFRNKILKRSAQIQANAQQQAKEPQPEQNKLS